MILKQLLLTAANYVDTAMVGSLGADATASVAINSSVCFLLMGLFAAAGVGYSVQVAHALGGRICSVPELRCIKQPAVLC